MVGFSTIEKGAAWALVSRRPTVDTLGRAVEVMPRLGLVRDAWHVFVARDFAVVVLTEGEYPTLGQWRVILSGASTTPERWSISVMSIPDCTPDAMATI